MMNSSWNDAHGISAHDYTHAFSIIFMWHTFLTDSISIRSVFETPSFHAAAMYPCTTHHMLYIYGFGVW